MRLPVGVELGDRFEGPGVGDGAGAVGLGAQEAGFAAGAVGVWGTRDGRGLLLHDFQFGERAWALCAEKGAGFLGGGASGLGAEERVEHLEVDEMSTGCSVWGDPDEDRLNVGMM